MSDPELDACDRELPAGWLVLFWIAVVVAALYWVYYHSLGAGQGPYERYAEAQLALMDQGGPVTAEELDKLARDPLMVESGKNTFRAFCVECHGERAQGKTGPNLTDEYWLHGGTASDIYTTIFLGKAGKGMPEWGAALGKPKVKQVAAFVLTLRNTNLPGKAPQGQKQP